LIVNETEEVKQTEPRHLNAVLGTFDQLWSPRIVTQVNDYDVRVAKVSGEYVWHSHEDTDEFFMVLNGELTIGLRDDAGERIVVLSEGDVFTVPKGMQHRPMSVGGASILMFERSGTMTTGDYAGDIPSHIDATMGHKIS
jgi:mannose-6-phosphate isomerase-like protein (cupin superfamily)